MNPFASIKHLADQVAHHKKKHEHLAGKIEAMTEGAVRLAEIGAGAWLGGMLEGKTGQGTFFHIPVNLGAGVALAAAGFLELAGDWSPHLTNVGDGMIASYAAATGYSFGKRWKETGKLFGGVAAPAPLPAPVPPPAVVQAAAAGDPYAMGQVAAAMGPR